MEKDTRNTKFHLKVIQITEENALLREEMAKLDDRNLILERQQKYFKRQLERIHEKYNELQREYDEQKDILDEIRRKEKEANIALQKSLKEQRILLKKLETAELEVLQVANLKDKLKEVTNEKVESIKKNAEIVEKLEKKHYECESFLISITNLKETNDNLRNNYEARENVIKMLRENNRQLEDENTELKLLRSVDTRTSIDRLSRTPHSDGESYCTIHDSPYTIFNDSNHQNSLYDELKASGFANMCSWNDTISRELKKEVQWYELEIHKLIQQTESVFQQLILARNEKCVNFQKNLTENSEKMNNLENLRQRIQILLDAVNAKLPEADIEIDMQVQIQNSKSRKNVCDLSTSNSNEYHVECFSKKNQIITSYDDISDKKQESFTKTMKSPKVIMVSETSTDDPIVQIFHKNVRPITSSHSSSPKKSTGNVSLREKERRRTLRTPTMCQDSSNDVFKIKVDIFGHNNGNYSDTIARIHSRCSPNGNNMKENEKLQFMDHLSLPINFATTFRPVTIKCNRKSKSESSLLPEKKALFSRSLNAMIPLSATEKINEAIEIKKSFGVPTCEETGEENKFQTEFKEKDVQNLINSHEYKFGGTYRCLNNSSDSSISSSSLRSENLLLEDFSLDGLEHCLYKLRPVQMAPMKLKLPLNKAAPFSKAINTQENFNAAINNTLIDNTKSECNRELKQYQIMENFDDGRSIKRDCNIISSDSYLNDINKEIYSINGETYLINKSTPNYYSKTSMYIRSFSNVDQESNTEIHVPVAYSTPMRVDSKNKNLFKTKYRNDQNDNSDSLIRQFANLKMSKTKIPIYRIYEDHLKETKIKNEWIENVDTENKNNTLSISLSDLKNVAFTNRKENSSEYSVTNAVEKNNTEESIKCVTQSEKKIVPTSLDSENQTSDRKENCQEFQDLHDETQFRKNQVKKIKKKSLLQQICKFNRSNSTKSNIQNDKVIGKETVLRNYLFHDLINILISPSWRVLISCLLVFLFAFYAVSGFLSMSINVGPPYKWWSLEEILNQYFPIVNTRFPPLL